MRVRLVSAITLLFGLMTPLAPHSGAADPCAADPITYGSFRPGERLTQEPGLAGYRQLRMDLYRPAADGRPDPSVLLVHGGGFRNPAEDRTGMRSVARELCGAGFVAYAADYRLICDAPQNLCVRPEDFRPGDPVRDLRAAMNWIHANAGTYQASTTEFGVLGSSAGGVLALMLGTVADSVTGTGTSAEPDAVVAWSATGLVLLAQGRNYLNCQPEDGQTCLAERSTAFSPILNASGAPPTLLAHGIGDAGVPAHASVEMYAALVAKSASPTAHEHKLSLYPTNAHGNHLETCTIEESTIFLGQHLGVSIPARGMGLEDRRERLQTCAGTAGVQHVPDPLAVLGIDPPPEVR